MKDYKRLTEKCYSCPVCENGKCLEPQYNCEEKEECEAWNRLFEIENKIESGELCDREEVRKETAREILDKVYESVESARLNSEYQDKKRKWVIDEYEFMSEFTLGALHNLYKKYGIDLFEKTEQVGNSDKFEDEE